MEKKQQTYINFPIFLLRNAMNNIQITMKYIVLYGAYMKAEKYELGEEKDRMRDAAKHLRIHWDDPGQAYNDAEQLAESIPDGQPFTGATVEKIIEFYMQKKNPNQKAAFLAYLGLKSLIGPKPYIKTTNEQMIVRMAGFKSIEEMGTIPSTLQPFTTRRKLDSIKSTLSTDWGVNIYAYYTRGFYVSFDKKFSLEKLAVEAEKRRKTYQLKQQQQQAKAAREMAIKTLINK